MTDLATIGLKVDSNGVVVAIDNLNEFAAAGGRAEKAATGVGNTATKASAQVKGLAGAEAAAAASAAKLGATQQRAGAQLNAYGLSAEQQAAAMRLLPAQITDIVTSLVSGQPAYLVAIQQGGQLKDSFGGIVPAARALTSVFTPMTLAIGATATVVGVLTTAYIKAALEQDNFNRAIINTGGYAGVTTRQLNDMADAIDAVVGTHTGAASTLTQLLNIGTLPGDSLQYLSQSAIEAQRTLGISTDEIVKNYAELSKSPVDASLKLNSALHYLNVEQLKQIQSLIDAGRETDAARAALVAYGAALHERAGEAEKDLSRLAVGWQGIKDVAGDAWDAMLGVGRSDNSIGDAIAMAAKGAGPLGLILSGISYLAKPANPQTPESPQDAARKQQERAIQDAGIIAINEINKLNEAALPKQAQLEKGIQLYKKHFADAAAAGTTYSDEVKALTLQNWTDKILGPTSDMNARISDVQNSLELLVASYQNAERSIEQAHSAGRISDQDYYDQSIKLIQDQAQAQIDALRQQNVIIAQEDAIGQKRIDNQQKIRDNAEKIKILQENAAASAALLRDRQQDANDAIARSFEQSRQAAQNYLDTLNRGYQRQISDFGAGPSARRFSSGLNQIDDQYRAQRQQLEAQRVVAVSPEQRAQLDQQINLVNIFHDRAILQYADVFDKIEERQRDLSAGFKESMLEWIDATKNAGTAIGNTLTGALDRANESTSELLTNIILFGDKGELSGRRIAATLIQDVVQGLVRVGLQMAENFALQQIFGAASLGQTAALATSATALWSPAAIAASIATFGGADAAGLSAYLAALASGTAASAATGLAGFDQGGYTGNYGRSQLAGVVHGQEFVVNANATSKYRGLLERINSGAEIASSYSQSQGVVQITNNAPEGALNIRYVNNVMTIDMAPSLVDVATGRAQIIVAQDAQQNGPITQAANARTGSRRLPVVAGRR